MAVDNGLLEGICIALYVPGGGLVALYVLRTPYVFRGVAILLPSFQEPRSDTQVVISVIILSTKSS